MEPTRLTPPEPPGMMHVSYGGVGPAVVPGSAGMMQQQSVRLSFNSPVAVAAASASKPVDSPNVLCPGDGGSGAGSAAARPGGMSEPMVKKKRGRPRKYENMSLALMPPGSGGSDVQSSEVAAKKRGRPRGPGKKHSFEPIGSVGTAFLPHMITANAGEDVASKIMAFSQSGSRTVCVLSANGVICNVSLRQPAMSGGTVTFEGRFEILSLSGSYVLTEDGGTRSRTGGLSVALASSDGRVLGGGVAGLLVAASPVQIVVASFNAEGKKPKPKPNIVKHDSSDPAPPQMTPTGSPPSQGTVSEASDEGEHNEAGSPPNQSAGNCNNNSTQHVQQQSINISSPYTSSMAWPQAVNFNNRHVTDMKTTLN